MGSHFVLINENMHTQKGVKGYGRTDYCCSSSSIYFDYVFLVCSGGTVDFIDGIRSAVGIFTLIGMAFKTCCPGKNYSSAD